MPTAEPLVRTVALAYLGVVTLFAAASIVVGYLLSRLPLGIERAYAGAFLRAFDAASRPFDALPRE